MRWFLMASPILRGGNLVVTEQGIREGVRQAILPLWNTWYFLSLYANAAGRVGVVAHRLAHVLDRYVLAKTAALVDGVTAAMEVHDIAGACEQVRDHAEVLTNWYVRRSRERFWDGDADAIDTLHTVLEVDRPGRRAAAAADHGDGVAGADRRAVGAPGRLARRGRAAARRRAGGGDGPGAAGGVGGAVAAQGRAGCGSGCRWPGSRWPRRTRRRWRRSRTSCATR